MAYRERSSHARLTGGKAWRTPDGLPPEAARWNTPYSRAEYRLDRLPPRFLRGLEGLLDDDERLLYAIERRPDPEAGLLERLRRPIDRRSALLALTDRQALWLVDHADPGRYLMDWGVDVELIPVERLDGPVIEALVGHFPPELVDEVSVARGLLGRFVAAAAGPGLAVRRRYPTAPSSADPDLAGRFGQAAEAAALERRLEREVGTLLAFLYSPRRPGQAWAGGAALGSAAVALAHGERVTCLPLSEVRLVRLVLSPLVGRLELRAVKGRRRAGRLDLPYPAPFASAGTAFVRSLRRCWANATA